MSFGGSLVLGRRRAPDFRPGSWAVEWNSDRTGDPTTPAQWVARFRAEGYTSNGWPATAPELEGPLYRLIWRGIAQPRGMSWTPDLELCFRIRAAGHAAAGQSWPSEIYRVDPPFDPRLLLAESEPAPGEHEFIVDPAFLGEVIRTEH